jgi:hypothetical protein
MRPEWFRRMGGIPGLDHTSPVRADRSNLPRHDVEPELQRYDFDGVGCVNSIGAW